MFNDRFVLAADRDNPQLAAVSGFDDLDGGNPGASYDLDWALMTALPFVAVAGEMVSLVDVQLRERGVELRVCPGWVEVYLPHLTALRRPSSPTTTSQTVCSASDHCDHA